MIKFDRKQDIVSIIAPSSMRRQEQERAEFASNIQELETIVSLYAEHGIKATYDKEIFSESELGYFAAPRQTRFNQLHSALTNPDVKIISSFRGGYGATELVIEAMKITPSGPKILIGFSDITALHLLFNQHYGYPSIHGLVNENFISSSKKIIDLLGSGKDVHKLLPANQVSSRNSKDITGLVAGGNLAILCNMMGTNLEPALKDKILIIEDISEKGARVFRLLMQLYNANLIQQTRAVIFADFTESDKELEPTINYFINNYLADKPVYRVSNIGHTDGYPFILNSTGVIRNDILEIENPFAII